MQEILTENCCAAKDTYSADELVPSVTAVAVECENVNGTDGR